MIPKPLAVAIVTSVALVWLFAFAAQFLIADYEFDGYLHTVFLIIVGGALGLSRKGNDPPSDPPPTAQIGGPEPTPPPEPDPPRAGGAHRAPFALLPRAAI